MVQPAMAIPKQRLTAASRQQDGGLKILQQIQR
jgi:hypothetical protein